MTKIKKLLKDMIMEVSYTNKVTMSIPLYERMKIVILKYNEIDKEYMKLISAYHLIYAELKLLKEKTND